MSQGSYGDATVMTKDSARPEYDALILAVKAGSLERCQQVIPSGHHKYQIKARKRWGLGHPINQKINEAFLLAQEGNHEDIIDWLMKI